MERYGNTFLSYAVHKQPYSQTYVTVDYLIVYKALPIVSHIYFTRKAALWPTSQRT